MADAAAHDPSTVFPRWRQCARPSNTRFLQPTPHHPERQLDRFSRFCTASAAFPPYVALRVTIHQTLPRSVVGSGPRPIHRSVGPPDTPSQTASRSSLLHLDPRLAVVTNERTDRPTDRQAERTRKSTGTNRPLIYAILATRPNNNNCNSNDKWSK